MASPALGMARVPKKPIDDFFVGIFGRIREESRALDGSRSQADHVQMDAAEQRLLERFGSELQPARRVRHRQKRIDLIRPTPAAKLRPGRHGWSLDRRKRPPRPR